MAFDCNNPRKPLLFSELFKPHRNPALEPPKLEAGSSSCSSTSTHFLSSFDSASSGSSTPELGSSESDESEFTAELTRQMAECMLQEDEPEDTFASEVSSSVKNSSGENYAHSGGFYTGPVCSDDRMPLQTQVYHGKNQVPVSKEGPFCRGRRVKGTESAQPKPIQKTEQQYMQHRGIRNEYSGSGMKAVFLGRSGPKIGPPGTGVFLPRDPAELKTKSGCSTVLIPTRVLQVLDLHFSRIQDSMGQPPFTPQDESVKSTRPWDGYSDIETLGADGDGDGDGDGDETQLPQEWTY